MSSVATGRPVAIVGPTASGKSALAMAIARGDPRWEIVSVDSMQVYRGMDVGTAKPTAAERAEVRHHLIDVVDPDEEWGVSEFQSACRAVLVDIQARGGRPLLVGGTGLYLRSVVDDLEIPPRYPEVRAEIELVGDTAALHERLAELDPVAASRMLPTNRRRVVRALEVTLGSGRPFSSYGPGLEEHPPTGWLLVGLHLERAELDERIARRLQAQMEAGFLDEVAALLAGDSGLSRTAAQALGYKELRSHLEGDASLAEAVAEVQVRTRRFARRQQRWFRRDPRLVWIGAGAADKPSVELAHLVRS